jgi:small GTP-binding protein
MRIDLTDVIFRSLVINPDDVEPLVKYLGMDSKSLLFEKGQLSAPAMATAKKIANYLREMGSNDFATIIRDGPVEYAEVVVDVAQKLGANEVREDKSVEENESILLRKLFAEALDKMSTEEKRQLFSSMGISGAEIPVGSAGMLIVQLLLKNFGGFATYRISLIVANMVARAVLGRGLAFATNAALMRVLGLAIGPIGWIASSLWLLIDLAGPAYRKTVPAVVHVAMLRQMLVNRVNIGVVGDGSTGKDALINAVFGVDTGNVNPVAGSTKDAMIYDIGNTGAVQLVNYPGFNDIQQGVNNHVNDILRYTDVFIVVVDISRGVAGTDVEILKKVQAFHRPILVCLNKSDLPRPKDKAALLKAAHDRLSGVDGMFETAFDPDPRLGSSTPVNCRLVYEWVLRKIGDLGKATAHINKSRYV